MYRLPATPPRPARRFSRPWLTPLLATAALFACGTAALALPKIQGGTGGGTSLSPAPFRPEKFMLSPGGVDMRSGRYVYSNVDLAIGPALEEGGIEFSRIVHSGVIGHSEPFGNFAHNWDIFITEDRIPVQEANVPGQYDYMMAVNAGGRSKTFRDLYSADSFEQISNDEHATLVHSGSAGSGVYTMTAHDGTIIKFLPINGNSCSYGTGRCASASEIIQPNGVRFTLTYDSTGQRLARVTSNRGYALILEYVGSSALVAEACVLNLAVTTPPATHACPTGVPTVSYAYDTSGRLTAFTDATNQTWTFGYTSTGVGSGTISFTRPNETSPYLTNSVFAQQDHVSHQQFADGRTYTYDWDTPAGEIAGGTVTDNQGDTIIVEYGDFGLLQDGEPTRVTTPGPIRIVDELGRTTTFDYCSPASPQGECIVWRVQSRTDPEGNAEHWTYDNNGNITERKRVAKPGSALANIVTSATFPYCSSAITCAKPGTVTDGRGNVTTFTYASTHGGVLTETGPAVNGVSPQTRYTYAARYAWYRDNNGTVVRAAHPIYVLTQTATCRTGAVPACIGTADEVITTYEYGPTTGANNLLLRGMVVDAGGLSLRTCYLYDGRGNRIAETRPRGTASTSCP